MIHLLGDIIRDTVLICGIVIIMMMMIESFNIGAHSKIFNKVGNNSFKQVIVAALLGCIPGCIGGFAAVSLYNRRLLSFGALVAMMVASCGDEAFVILAMMPDKALWIFALLFALAVAVGVILDLVWKGPNRPDAAPEAMGHGHDHHSHSSDHHDHAGGEDGKRSLTWQRAVLFVTIAAFIVALSAGWLEHDHAGHTAHGEFRINLLSEWWMNLLFAILSAIMLVILCFKSDSFIKEVIWDHTVCRHLPGIFAWTFGILLTVGILGEYVDIERWVSSNAALMVLLAVVVGIIPESGPHLIFVTLYASGLVPLPVLLASCISQDGHSSLPLLAQDRRSFIYGKGINCLIALIVGFGALLLT